MSKIYLHKKQLTARADIIIVEIDNSKIANRIATTAKTK